MSEAPTTPAVKETKAQKAERLKREKNPWQALDEIRTFARAGLSSVPEEWSTYFRWWGIYTQGDGLGVTGGVGGEGKSTEFFMMRVGLPNGIVSSAQARVLAQIAKQHGRNLADITVRQNIQYHWLTIQSLPEIIDTLGTVGLSSKGACGDVVRNVTGCPLAGLAADEIIDASPLALDISRLLSGNPDFYNLPRKFKISVTGCPQWCSYPEINEIGLTAVRRGNEIGYALRVGGGLSTAPHLGVKLNAFIRQDQALDAMRAVAQLFNDQQVLRESRDRARMKYLFLREGWDAARFLDELHARMAYRLDSADGTSEQVPDDVLRDHVGIHAQKQEGLHSVGASVLGGRLTGEQLEATAELAERFGNGSLRTTIMQNLIFVNIPKTRSSELARELQQIGLHVDGSFFRRGAIACTGTEYCKLAITETKGFARWLVDEMETRLPEFDQQLKLNVTGCTNSCGQHWIADIGIVGKKIKHEGKMADAYYFCLGGALGEHAGIARTLGYRCLATQIPDAIERLLRSYLRQRQPGENLRAYFARNSDAELHAQLEGSEVAAALPALTAE